ncbi:hypothetical protein ACFQY9_08305 [Microvirga aerilata]|uniref:hypothetical protein n=1 Tax=Microvirga aerilata TaxID=670292 RepID=UPI0036329C04
MRDTMAAASPMGTAASRMACPASVSSRLLGPRWNRESPTVSSSTLMRRAIVGWLWPSALAALFIDP